MSLGFWQSAYNVSGRTIVKRFTAANVSECVEDWKRNLDRMWINGKSLRQCYQAAKLDPKTLTETQLQQFWHDHLIPKNDRNNPSRCERWQAYFANFLHQGGLLFRLQGCCYEQLNERGLAIVQRGVKGHLALTCSENEVVLNESFGCQYIVGSPTNQQGISSGVVELQSSGNDYLVKGQSMQRLHQLDAVDLEQSGQMGIRHEVLQVKCQVNHPALQGLLDERSLLARLMDFFKQLFLQAEAKSSQLEVEREPDQSDQSLLIK